MALYGRSFQLFADFGQGKSYRKEPIATVVLPEPRHLEEVVAAWSYAVRYGANGLDAPNYEKALILLKQRHPTWIVVDSRPIAISYDPALADKDTPER